MNEFLAACRNRLRTAWQCGPWLKVLLAVGVLALIVALAVPRLRGWRSDREQRALTGEVGGSPQLPGQIAAARVPGQIALDDFQIVVPPGWQRRKDWEDEGPGTKLFLLGPKVQGGQLVVGIDVYPLPSNPSLADFVTQYAARWNQALVTDKPATLCEQPARMLAVSENGLEKVYLVTVWRGKGLAIGMIAPTGQMTAATPTFRLVVDSFQLYE